MTGDLDEDAGYLRASWRAERIGWICIAAIVVAGAAGLFGRGPLVERSISNGPLSVTYDFVARRDAPSRLVIRVDGDPAHAGTVHPPPSGPDTILRIWASRPLVQGCGPRQFQPALVRTTADSGVTVFTLAVGSRAAPSMLMIECSPTASGRFDGAIGLVGGPQVAVRILVLP